MIAPRAIAATAGQAVDAALTPHKGATANTMDIVDALEQSKQPYIGKTTAGDPVVNDATLVKAISKLQDTLMEYGDDISVESMVKLRRNLDRIVEEGKGFTTAKVKNRAWAAREARTAIRQELEQTVPDINKLNAEYAFWQTLEDVAAASNERTRASSLGTPLSSAH